MTTPDPDAEHGAEVWLDLADVAPGPAHPGSRRAATAAAAAAADPAELAARDGLTSTEPYALRTREQAAVFGNYVSVQFAGTEGNIFRLMPYDPERARGYVIVSGTGPAYVGKRDAIAELKANGIVNGQLIAGVAVLQSGQTLPITHQESVFAACDGSHGVTIVATIERWTAEAS